MNALLAQLKNTSKQYGAIHALTDLTLDVRAGEVLALLGANGAGKSTSIGLLTGLLRPDAGTVEVLGGDPRDVAVRRGLGVMLQDGGLPDALLVREHVELFSTYYPSPRPVAQTLELAGLTGLALRPYHSLSGGQKRRVQFALAVCGNPSLLFVDEPTVGLDIESRRNFWSVLKALRAEGTGIVLTTHYLEEVDALADRVVVLAKGRVVAEDTPRAIKSKVAGKRITAKTTLPLDAFRLWPDVRSVTQRDDRATELVTHDAERVVRRWLAEDAHLSDLEVRALSLEDAFVSLTGTHA